MKARRPKRTLLLVAADRWVRVDLARDGSVVGGVSLDARSAAPLPAAVAELLAKGGAAGARIVLLAELLWTQTLELPLASVNGLGPAELARALAWELEPSSGVPAADAALAWTRLADPAPGRARFWVLEQRASERDAIARAAAEHGARIERIAHPLGLARGDGRVRVEVCEQATLVATPHTTRVIASRPAQRSWEQALREEFAAHGALACTWIGRARGAQSPARELGERLDDRGPWPFEREGETWLVDAVTQLDARTLEVPSLTPPAPVRTGFAPILVGVVLTLLVAGWAWFDRRELVRRVSVRELEAANAEQSVSQTRALEKSNATAKNELAELTKRIDARKAKLAPLLPEWDAQRQRLRTLLTALGQDRPQGLTILRVKNGAQGTLEVGGVGLATAAIDRYAAELAPRLREAHWEMLPARTTERAMGGRSVFEFVLTIVPLAADALASPRASDGARATGRVHAIEAAASPRGTLAPRGAAVEASATHLRPRKGDH